MRTELKKKNKYLSISLYNRGLKVCYLSAFLGRLIDRKGKTNYTEIKIRIQVKQKKNIGRQILRK